MFKFKKKSPNKEVIVNTTNNKAKNTDNINGLPKWKKNLKRWCVGLVCVSLLLFASFENTKRIDSQKAMTDFSSKVVNIGGPISLQGNYNVSVWRSGNTVYCKAHVYVAAPNGAWQSMGASMSTNHGSASNTFVGDGSAAPKAGSGDVQFSFNDGGAGTISGTIYAGFMSNLNGSQALSATFSVSYPASQYTVTYNGNGGLYNGSSTWSNTAKYNENYTTYSNDNFFVRTGYKFNGWNERADGSGTDWTGWINKPWKWTYEHGVTLYAQWKPINYTVTYNGNGADSGGTSSSSHVYDTAKNLTANGYTRNGYAFLGWSTSPNGSVQYSNGQSVKNLTATNGATVPLYAQWKQLGYEINYDGNGADGGSTPTQYAPFNQKTTLNKNGYYKKGYKFKEWNSKANGSGESYKDQQNISVDGNKTVTKQ